MVRAPSVGDGELAFGHEDEVPREGDIFCGLERDSIILHRAAEEAAGNEAGEFDEFAFAGEEKAVAGIPDERAGECALVVGALGILNDWTDLAVSAESSEGGGTVGIHDVAHIINDNALEAVFVPEREGAPDLLAGLEREACIFLSVNFGEEVRIAVVGFDACGEFVAQEPWLGEGGYEILTQETVLRADAETLSAAGESRPVHNIEVRLLKFRKTNQAIDRAEAGAEVERAGAFFLHDDIEVLAAGHDGVGRLGLDALEVVQILQALFADVHECGVVDLAGFDGQLAPDHAVLRAGVALDIDEVQVGLNSLVDRVGEIHRAGAGREDFGHGRHVHITAAAIEITNRLEVIAHAFGSEKLAGVHFELTHNLALGSDIHPIDADLIHAVFGALADRHDQLHALACERLGLDFRDIHIGETTVLVEGLDGDTVIFDLGGFEATALVEEGQKIERLCLHHLAEVAVEDRVVADESDFFDDELRSLGDGEDQACAVLAGDVLHAVLHIDIGVVAVVVEFEDLLAVLLDALLVHHIAGFDFQIAAHAVEGNLLRALDDDFF